MATGSVELINMFLDLYSKHIGHANMVLSHANGQNHRAENGYAGSAWSPSDPDLSTRGEGRDHRQNASASNGADATGAGGNTSAWHQPSSHENIQHPATPLLDTLSQCQTWARHGGVM